MKRQFVFSKLTIPHRLRKSEKLIRLWRAVLDQAVLDAKKVAVTADEIENKEVALIWLRGNTSDFVSVCDLAVLDYKEVRTAIERLVGGRDKLFK